MNFISSCLAWKKAYTVLESRDFKLKDYKPTTIYLNIFQRIGRRIFGMYRNTHLEYVGSQAQRACIQPNRTWSALEKETIHKLMEKTKRKYGLKAYNLSDISKGGSDERLRFQLEIDREGLHIFITLINDRTNSERESYINIGRLRRETDRLGIFSIFERTHYLQKTTDFYKDDSFLTNKNDPLVRVTYLFLSKILRDSKKVKGFNMVVDINNPYLIGGALLAKEYGFNGQVTEFFDCVDKETGKNIPVGRPDYLTLEQANALPIDYEAPIPEEPISADFFLDDAR